MNPGSTVRIKRLQGDKDIVVCKGGVSDVQTKLNKIYDLHDMNILAVDIDGDQLCVIVERIRRKDATE